MVERNPNRTFKNKETPFTIVFGELISSRGFPSGKAIAEEMGVNPIYITRWRRGYNNPSPKHFGKLVLLFQPYDDKLEDFVEAYAQDLRRGKGVEIEGQWELKPKEMKLKISESRMGSSKYPIGQWIEKYCKEKGITLEQFRERLDMRLSDRDSFGIGALNKIFWNGQSSLGLTEDEKKEFQRAIDETKRLRIKQGHRFQSSNSRFLLSEMKKRSSSNSYNGSEAAKILGISREWVRKLRMKFNLPLLLTDSDIQMLKFHLLKSYLARTTVSREKQIKHKINSEQTIFESNS